MFATQSLLKHIDALIYLDTDSIVVSNLTEFWQHFRNEMKDKKLAALAPNNVITAPGWYNTKSKIPYYGDTGQSNTGNF